jgi:hypothetical protein
VPLLLFLLHPPSASPVLDPSDMLSSRRLPHLLALPHPPAWLPTPLETALLTQYVHVWCLLPSYSPSCHVRISCSAPQCTIHLCQPGSRGKSIPRLLRHRLSTVRLLIPSAYSDALAICSPFPFPRLLGLIRHLILQPLHLPFSSIVLLRASASKSLLVHKLLR